MCSVVDNCNDAVCTLLDSTRLFPVCDHVGSSHIMWWAHLRLWSQISDFPDIVRSSCVKEASVNTLEILNDFPLFLLTVFIPKLLPVVFECIALDAIQTWLHSCGVFVHDSDVALSVCMMVVVRRRFETHHQAEAVGPAGGADRQVRVAPRGSRVLRWLPAPHAGAGPRKESHGRRVLAPPLACPLVETSSHCTFLLSPPSYSLQRLQQITFQFGHIRWIFISLFLFHRFLDYLCFCYWTNASVYVCFVCVGSSLSVMTLGI